MGKSILFLFVFLMSSAGVFSQGYYDDMYYTPSEDKEDVEEETSLDSHNDNYGEVYDNAENESSDIIDGRDVDEYNRRYIPDSSDNAGNKPAGYSGGRKNSDDDNYSDDGWVNGYNGSQSDYEYSTRIIRMNNPSLAIHISSPYYWDIVYGSSSFDWNVYVDGSYAYAFPTFSNPLWWNWRFSRPYYNYYSWYYPYYPGFYAGGYPYYWGGWHYHYHHCYPFYGYYPDYGYYPNYGYYNGNRIYRNNYRTGSTGRTGAAGNRVGTTSRRSGSYNSTARRSSINNSGAVRRSSSTYNRRSNSNSSWGGTDNNRNSSSSFQNGPRRGTSTYNRRSSTVNSGFDNRNQNRSSSFSSPARSGSYNSSRSSYTPSSRSGSRR